MKLEIQNLGPVKNAAIEFGDLTVLVGPQATGKSITLQLLKLLVDTGFVQAELRRSLLSKLDCARVNDKGADLA